MTRKHRRVHRVIWPIIALALALGFLFALVLRAPAAAIAPVAMEQRP